MSLHIQPSSFNALCVEAIYLPLDSHMWGWNAWKGVWMYVHYIYAFMYVSILVGATLSLCVRFCGCTYDIFKQCFIRAQKLANLYVLSMFYIWYKKPVLSNYYFRHSIWVRKCKSVWDAMWLWSPKSFVC